MNPPRAGETLPVLRNDLRLYPWQPAPRTGEALWALHDPIRNRFFLLTEDAIEILKRFDLGSVAQVVTRVNSETARRIDAADVQATVAFLQQNQLLKLPAETAAESLMKLKDSQRAPLFTRIIHNYFFFRIPLVRPDAFLDRTLGLVAPLFTRWFFLVTLIAGVIGIVLTIRDWHSFEYQLRNLWSFSGLAKIVLTFIFVKLVHELAHAYSAKRDGVHVPVMGVAFLFMFPFPYTDTTESWKLNHHKQRLGISAAGVVSELTLAAWATLMWKIVAPGPVQDALFLIATTTWISSLTINLSPFMRFDGYFVLMDYLQIPNLHKRAGDLGRWKLRELLFRFGDPLPESFAPGVLRFLIGFAYVTWLYRLTVFVAIAVVLFFLLPQPLGLLVFAVEVHFLILRPILQELRVWWKRRTDMTRSPRAYLTMACVLVLLALCFVPFEGRHAIPGLYEPYREELLYAPEDGEVLELSLARGQRVEAGDILLRLGSRTLENELTLARLAAERLSRQAGNAAIATEATTLPGGLDRGWRAALRRVEALEERIARLEIRAPLAGRIADVATDLRPGVTIARNSPLAVLETGPRQEIILYVGEDIRAGLSPGQLVSFFSHSAPETTLQARVVFVATNPTRSLDHPELSSVHGGPLRSFRDPAGLVFDTPMFPVRLRVDTAALSPQRQLVTLRLAGERNSLAGRTLNRLTYLLRQEFGG
jgi:putative peptide zinc metalloprotease protein